MKPTISTYLIDRVRWFQGRFAPQRGDAPSRQARSPQKSWRSQDHSSALCTTTTTTTTTTSDAKSHPLSSPALLVTPED